MQKHSSKSFQSMPGRPWLLLFTLFLLLGLFSHLDYLPLTYEEPRRALVSMEMIVSQDFVVPKVNQNHYYNKPPLYNWLIAGLFLVLDDYPNWAVRLINVVSFLLTGLILFFWIKSHFPIKIALLATLMYFTSLDLLFYFTLTGEIDLFYSLIVFLQVLSIHHFSIKKQWWRLFLISYLLTALGLMTKGLPSLAFQAITLLAWLSYSKNFKKLFSLAHFSGILLLFALVGAYFYAYHKEADVLPYVLRLFNESSRRTVGQSAWQSWLDHTWRFPLLLLQITAPWILLMPFLLKKRHRKTKDLHLIFVWIFIIANLLLYLLSPGTRQRYLYMFVPFFMFLLAYAYYFNRSRLKQYQKALLWLFFGLMVIGSLSILGIPFLMKNPNTDPWLWPKLILAASILLAFSVGSLSQRNSYLFTFALFLVFFRVAFNFFYQPLRMESGDRDKFLPMAKSIAQYSAGQPLNYVDRYQYQWQRIPFAKSLGYEKQHYLFREPDWPAYQISFYINKERKDLLRYTQDHEAVKGFVLTPDPSQIKGEYEFVKAYRLPQRKELFFLIKKHE